MATKQIAKTAPVVEIDNSTEAQQGKRPYIKASIHGMMFGVVWLNVVEREDGTTFTSPTFDIYRRYQNKNGVWQSSHNFRTQDMPKVALLANLLWEKTVLLGVEVDTAQASD